jgi:hypothetical protein
MGLGFGGGRRFTIAMDDDIGERSGCMRVLQRVELHVRRFANEADGAEPIIRTDVVGWGARELTLLADCPFCGGVGEPGPLEYEQDLPQALDLRTFDGPVKRETSYSLDGSRKTDIGLSLAVPGAAETVHVGFQLEQQTRLECTATYSFPPGRFYVPYRSRDAPATLPYWAVR